MPSSSPIEALVAAMTLREKIGQLTMLSAPGEETGPARGALLDAAVRKGEAGGVLNLVGAERIHHVQTVAVKESRLRIPTLFGLDVVHGYRTITPIPLAEACAFDPPLWQETGYLAALEASRAGIALTFAPMLDVCRDPRWGRIAEGPGEDPWLACLFARAKVRGLQGASPRDLERPGTLGATAKHFGAYGAVTGGRDYASVDVSDRLLHEVYFPPFRAAVEAGVAAVMPAFVDLAGIPVTANRHLLRGLLRDAWGFDGVIVSDYHAIAELVAHGVAADLVEAAALALRASVDIDMMGGAYAAGLEPALERGLVTIEEVDEAVRRVLRLKERLGLFEDPYRGLAAGGGEGPPSPAAREIARRAARRSAVLLKNEGPLLPLAAEGGPVAVIGPTAAALVDMLGPWSAQGHEDEVASLPDALRTALPGRLVLCPPGAMASERDAMMAAARAASHIVLCLGETRDLSGEAASRADPVLPQEQVELAGAVFGLGRPVVLVLSSGRPLVASEVMAGADAILATWFLGSEAGPAIADLLAGAAEPVGRLALSWPASIGQIPVYFGHRNTGRPFDAAERYSSRYIDAPDGPLFPFGHGLGYARIAIADVRITALAGGAEGLLDVDADLRNAGEREGEETVFLFVRDLVASIARPVLELRGSAKIVLAGNAEGSVRFTLSAADLSFPGQDCSERLEPGRFAVLVGFCADPERLVTRTIRLLETGLVEVETTS